MFRSSLAARSMNILRRYSGNKKSTSAPANVLSSSEALDAEVGEMQNPGLWLRNSIPFARARVGNFVQEPPQLGNQYTQDTLLRSFLKRHVPEQYLAEIEADLERFGQRVATDIYDLHLRCERESPTVEQTDAWGQRVDRLITSTAWRDMHDIAAQEGLIALAYERNHGESSRLYQITKLYLYAPSSGLYSCPLAMADGAAKIIEFMALLHGVNVAAQVMALLHGVNVASRCTVHGSPAWSERGVTTIQLSSPWLIERAFSHLTSRDPAVFWTSGQWMTEKRGGSDVARGTETVAIEQPDGTYRLYGYKWFSSATDADMTFTLARIADKEGNTVEGTRGLSLFYLELRGPDGKLNNIQIQKLKNKLGTRQLPTAELLLDGSTAFRGVVVITGHQGVVVITGHQGIVVITGHQGIVVITGHQGIVVITGHQGVVVITGHQGIVVITGHQGVVVITGHQGIVVITGHQGVVVITGHQGVVVNTGHQGVVVITGHQGVVVITGHQGVVVNTGHQGIVVITGHQGIVVITGHQGVVVITGHQGIVVITGHQGVVVITGHQGIVVSDEGRGVAGISNMLTLTRLHNSLSAASSMRRMVNMARDYSTRRSAFGSVLKDYPLHIQTLARMEVETRGAELLVLEVGRLLGLEEVGVATETEKQLMRLLVPVMKLYTGKQAIAVASEGLECFGGQGFIEDTGLPMILRDAQVLTIWEGTTNVLSLDVLRAMAKSRGGVLKAFAENVGTRLQSAAGREELVGSTNKVAKGVEDVLAFAAKNTSILETAARDFAFSIARVAIGAMLIEHAASGVGTAQDVYTAQRWCEKDLVPVLAASEANAYSLESVMADRQLVFDGYPLPSRL
ncbi:hypothetical protein BaRGS_00025333 [Batillaria attramentaria]|uniref:Acyl-CoA dehydrogenase n=1 Tax=Batillaria attramentaria TaxID=370345 RepID=A0ABD0K8K8_9CAEN